MHTVIQIDSPGQFTAHLADTIREAVREELTNRERLQREIEARFDFSSVYVTPTELAIAMSVHKNTVAKWERAGLIHGERLGKLVRYKVADVVKSIHNGDFAKYVPGSGK